MHRLIPGNIYSAAQRWKQTVSSLTVMDYLCNSRTVQRGITKNCRNNSKVWMIHQLHICSKTKWDGMTMLGSRKTKPSINKADADVSNC